MDIYIFLSWFSLLDTISRLAYPSLPTGIGSNVGDAPTNRGDDPVQLLPPGQYLCEQADQCTVPTLNGPRPPQLINLTALVS